MTSLGESPLTNLDSGYQERPGKGNLPAPNTSVSAQNYAFCLTRQQRLTSLGESALTGLGGSGQTWRSFMRMSTTALDSSYTASFCVESCRKLPRDKSQYPARDVTRERERVDSCRKLPRNKHQYPARDVTRERERERTRARAREQQRSSSDRESERASEERERGLRERERGRERATESAPRERERAHRERERGLAS